MTMMDRVLELPQQLAWGRGVTVGDLPRDRALILLGMGGSAMAASVGMLAARRQRPMVVHRTYGLPPWAATSDPLVIAVSYSGNTEEVLSGVEEALDLGLEIAGIASGGTLSQIATEHGFPFVTVPGGMQPRAGVGYQAAAVTQVLEAAGAVDDADSLLDEAAGVLVDLLGDGEGAAVGLGRDIAGALGRRVPIIYGGAGLGSLAAYRWKTQFNENTKVPAYAGEIPELDHNELEGWTGGGEFVANGVGLVYLRDADDHPRIASRIDLTEQVLETLAPQAGSVRSQGSGALSRFFSLAVVGDVASVAMAEATGVDPTPVPTLERFKDMLREDG